VSRPLFWLGKGQNGMKMQKKFEKLLQDSNIVRIFAAAIMGL
jgi:hypothetical protein